MLASVEKKLIIESGDSIKKAYGRLEFDFARV